MVSVELESARRELAAAERYARELAKQVDDRYTAFLMDMGSAYKSASQTGYTPKILMEAPVEVMEAYARYRAARHRLSNLNEPPLIDPKTLST